MTYCLLNRFSSGIRSWKNGSDVQEEEEEEDEEDNDHRYMKKRCRH
jgi:hypothetical protein